MKKPKLGVSNSITLSYALIICVALCASIACILIVRNNKGIDREISELHQPEIVLLKEFTLLVENSKKLTNNWIYQPNKDEKDHLKMLHSTDYPKLKKQLIALVEDKHNNSSDEKVKGIFKDFEGVIESQAQVMSVLASEEDYNSDTKIDLAITSFDKTIVPQTTIILKKLKDLLEIENDYLLTIQKDKENSYSYLNWMLFIMMMLIVLVTLVATYFTRKNIINPLTELKNTVTLLGRGEVDTVVLTDRNDEIGQMVNAMVRGLKVKSDFATEIGNGNYNQEFSLISEKDSLGKALVEMRNNLKSNTEEDRKRNWASEGIGKFAEILRSTDDLNELSYSLISNLVKYLNANQGYFFLIQHEQGAKDYLELTACYAYNKKKYLQKRIEWGEGITGSAWQDGDTVYLTEIPEDYVQITSGVGEALPRCIIIVPLKVNEEIHGVIEIASFRPLEKHEIVFIEKIAETIGSTISVVRINMKTKKLLVESQQQEEMLRAQEEEMRQNLEELKATQEEMDRKDYEKTSEIDRLKNLLQNK